MPSKSSICPNFFFHRCIAFVTGGLVRLNENRAKQRLIVQHLLETRHEPLPIGRIAMETAAEMVVDAAGCNGLASRVNAILTEKYDMEHTTIQIDAA